MGSHIKSERRKSRNAMRAIALLLGGTAAATLAHPAFAQDAVFTGAASEDWHNPNNWADGAEPAPDDNVLINIDGSAVLGNFGGDTTIAGLSIGTAGGTPTSRLSIQNGDALQSNGQMIDGVLTDRIGSGAGNSGLLQFGLGGVWNSKADRVIVGADGANGTIDARTNNEIKLGDLYVGVDGGSGTITLSNMAFSFGNGPTGITAIGASGTGHVSGNNLSGVFHGALMIGGSIDDIGEISSGHGGVSFFGGAKIQLVGTPEKAAQIVVGIGEGSFGDLAVRGDGTTWGGDAATMILGVSGGQGGLDLEDRAFMTTGSIGAGIGKGPNTDSLGTISVESGARLLTQGSAVIGLGSTAGNSALVTGADSYWTVEDGLAVGGAVQGDQIIPDSFGRLDVRDGGYLLTGHGPRTLGDSIVGAGNGSFGAATIADRGTWESTGTIAVGVYGGTGSVTLESQSALRADGLLVGFNPTLDPDGAYVGGAGTLTASGDSDIATRWALVGLGLDVTGTVTVSGGNWTIDGDYADRALFVGYLGGTGRVALDSGSTLTTTGDGIAQIGTLVGDGAVALDASTWTSESAIIVGGSGLPDGFEGDGGLGTLGVANGSAVVAPILMIGAGHSGGSGAVTVDGLSSLTIDAALYVGADPLGDATEGTAASASLQVSGGSHLASETAWIGQAPFGGDAATLTVTGIGSAWINTGDVFVGLGRPGIVRIGDQASAALHGTVDIGVGGATATAQASIFEISGGATVTSGDLADPQFAYTLIANGDARVIGAGSRWDGGGLIAAQDATIEVLDGGTLTTRAGAYTFGNSPVSNGSVIGFGDSASVRVAGAGSSWTAAGTLLIGRGSLSEDVRGGDGTVSVEDGGTLSVEAGLTLGYGVGSVGMLKISGTGAATTDGPLLVGDLGGTGMVAIDRGGQLTNGYGIIANGGMTIDGATSLWRNNGTLAIGGQGPGSLAISNGGEAQIGSSVRVGEAAGGRGNLTLASGGTLLVAGDVELAHGTIAVPDGNLLAYRLTVDNGATLAIGSTGLASIERSVVQRAGSIYDILIDSTDAPQNALITTADTATIEDGAVLRATLATGQLPAIGTRYTILSAAGGVNGRYTFENPLLTAFAGFADGYTPTSVYIEFGQLRAFAEAGLTPNQIAAGAGADSLPVDNAIKNAILMLPDDATARDAFDQLSGELYPSVGTTLIEDSRLPRMAVLGRLVEAEGGTGAWLQGVGNWGSTDSDGNAATVDRNTKGMFGGMDVAPGGGALRIGLAGGYTDATARVSARSSHADIKSYTALGYAGGAFGRVRLRGGVGYSWSSIDAARSIAFPGFADSLRASYDASVLQGFGELGYRMPVATGWIEPFAGITAVRVSTDAVSETGGAAALSLAKERSNVTYSTLGLKASTSVTGPVFASLSLDWRHRLDTGSRAWDTAFAGSPSFQIAGAPLAKDSADLELGVGWRLLPGISLSANYSGDIGQGSVDNAVTARLAIVF